MAPAPLLSLLLSMVAAPPTPLDCRFVARGLRQSRLIPVLHRWVSAVAAAHATFFAVYKDAAQPASGEALPADGPGDEDEWWLPPDGGADAAARAASAAVPPGFAPHASTTCRPAHALPPHALAALGLWRASGGRADEAFYHQAALALAQGVGGPSEGSHLEEALRLTDAHVDPGSALEQWLLHALALRGAGGGAGGELGNGSPLLQAQFIERLADPVRPSRGTRPCPARRAGAFALLAAVAAFCAPRH